MALLFEYAGKTDVGCVRANNEDNFGVDPACGLFVVADGMGGQAAGEVASAMAVSGMIEYVRKNAGEGDGTASSSDSESLLINAISFANDQIRKAAAGNPSQKGMGSTIVATLWDGNAFHIAHVGDSRVYLIRHHSVQQLTMDHSLVMEEVRRGLMSLEEARSSGLQNFILRALGAEDTVQPDILTVPAEPLDVLLLTTDGLVRHVEDNRILQLVESASTMEEACDLLIQDAKDGGGNDNVTCVMIRVAASAEPARPA